MERKHGFFECPPDASGTADLEEMLGSVRWDGDEYDVSSLFDKERVMDQGATGSCVRHALARAIQCCARARFARNYELPSARHMTHLVKTLLGSAWNWDGTTLAAAVEAVQDAGIIKESECPWSPEQDGMVDYDDLQKGLECAIAGRQVRSHRCIETGQARKLAFLNSLRSGCGIAVGISVDKSFSWVRDDSIWQMTGPREGGHAMALVGVYGDRGVCLNSYGEGHGQEGFVSIAIDHLLDPQTCPSAWIVDIAPEWAANW